MPKNTQQPLKSPPCLSAHSSFKNPGQHCVGPGSLSGAFKPTSLLLALLCLAGYQAQAAEIEVKKGETSNGAVIQNGDTQVVNGTAEKTSLQNRGIQFVQSGGTAKNTTVESSGKVYVFKNGTIENLTVKSGGDAYLETGSIWQGYIRYEPGSNSPGGATLSTTWKMTDDSAFNFLYVEPSGHIDFEAPGGKFAAKTLSIDKLIGRGGLITLNQVLDEGSMPGDKIIIRDKGSVTGSTFLAIRNHGGLGGKTTGDGMLVVEAQGSAVTTAQSSKDGFKLKQPVYAGAYEYRLRAGDANGNGQNWYLSSQLGSPSNGQLNGQTAYRPASAALPALMDLSGRMALHALLNGPQSVGSSMDTSTDPNAKH
ncbi:AIDA repeat-containing protein, partial [Methylophilus luteus]